MEMLNQNWQSHKSEILDIMNLKSLTQISTYDLFPTFTKSQRF